MVTVTHFESRVPTYKNLSRLSITLLEKQCPCRCSPLSAVSTESHVMGGAWIPYTSPGLTTVWFSQLWIVNEGPWRLYIHMTQWCAGGSGTVPLGAALEILGRWDIQTCESMGLQSNACGDTFLMLQYLHLWAAWNGFQLYTSHVWCNCFQYWQDKSIFENRFSGQNIYLPFM